MTYEDLKNEALVALSAGADEQSFGASSLVGGKAQKELRDKYPNTAVGARIVSYLPGLLAGTGEAAMAEKGLGSLARMLPQSLLNKGAGMAAKALPFLEKGGAGLTKELAKSSGRGGISALLAGTGNRVARKAVTEVGDTGTQEPSPSLDDSATQGAIGMALGPVGELAEKAAPYVYKAPALLNRNNLKGSNKMADEMLQQGIWGSVKGTFKPHAERLKDEIRIVRDKILPNAIKNEQDAAARATRAVSVPKNIPGPNPPRYRGQTPVADLDQMAENKVRDAYGNTTGEDRALRNSFGKAKKGLRPDYAGNTTLGDVDRNSKLINTEIKETFTPADKGKTVGDLDGPLSSKKARLQGLKTAHDDLLEQGIDAHGNTAAQNQALDPKDTLSDVEKFGAAKKVYGKGASLEGTLNDFERGELGDAPHIGHGLVRSGFNAVKNNTAMRTGLGVLLSGASPEVMGAIGGRTVDGSERASYNKATTARPGVAHFLETNEKPATEPDNPYMKTVRESSQPAPGENPYLDAVGQ